MPELPHNAHLFYLVCRSLDERTALALGRYGLTIADLDAICITFTDQCESAAATATTDSGCVYLPLLVMAPTAPGVLEPYHVTAVRFDLVRRRRAIIVRNEAPDSVWSVPDRYDVCELVAWWRHNRAVMQAEAASARGA
jgi:hypothetical protein